MLCIEPDSRGMNSDRGESNGRFAQGVSGGADAQGEQTGE